MHITGIFIYPIKGTRAISLPQAEVHPRGLLGDRRWMVVDAEGRFLQQRIQPQLAIVRTTVMADRTLRVEVRGMPPLQVAVPTGEQRLTVTVWGDQVDAAGAGPEAAAWFSELLGLPCRLAFMDQLADRPVTSAHGCPGDRVSFADTMPLLLASEASLADLNRRLSQPVPMPRFRPNVVVDGVEPWSEEAWKRLQIGQVDFEGTHPCVRCVVTTIDQQSGEKVPDGEPLKTLATFHRSADGVCFGLNLAPRGTGTIRVGDEVLPYDSCQQNGTRASRPQAPGASDCAT